MLWGSLPSCLNVLQELSRTGALLVKRLAKHDVYFESISIEVQWNPIKTGLKIGLWCEVHMCGSVKERFEGKWSERPGGLSSEWSDQRFYCTEKHQKTTTPTATNGAFQCGKCSQSIPRKPDDWETGRGKKFLLFRAVQVTWLCIRSINRCFKYDKISGILPPKTIVQ